MRKWTTLESTELLSRPPWLRVFSEDIQLPSGRIVREYLRLETPNYAVIVPVNVQGRIGLVRSYKRGPDAIDVQPPAGVIEYGEDPLHAAKRELLEELGCRSRDWSALGAYVLAGNLRGGTAHIFLARDCQKVAEPDSGDLEEPEPVWLPVSEVEAMWRGGGMAQLGSVAAVGLALAQLSGPDD
jgi:ADP-ribose pyrophosphatase